MTLEDVKDYAGYNNANLNSYTELTDEGKEVIKWLIAELEKAKECQTVADFSGNSMECILPETLIKQVCNEVAIECAVISGQTSKVAEHRIKLRFGLCG